MSIIFMNTKEFKIMNFYSSYLIRERKRNCIHRIIYESYCRKFSYIDYDGKVNIKRTIMNTKTFQIQTQLYIRRIKEEEGSSINCNCSSRTTDFPGF